MVPLDMLPLPVYLSFMRGHYRAGMKANWIILIHHTSSPWRLMDIYTKREITLPSLDTAAIEPRGPPDTPAYYARDASSFWLDLCLQNLQSAHTIRRLHGLQAHCLVQQGISLSGIRSPYMVMAHHQSC